MDSTDQSSNIIIIIITTAFSAFSEGDAVPTPALPNFWGIPLIMPCTL